MLTLRLIGVNDYRVREDGQPIGRIRFAEERTPGIWIWTISVNIHGSPSVVAGDLLVTSVSVVGLTWGTSDPAVWPARVPPSLRGQPWAKQIQTHSMEA